MITTEQATEIHESLGRFEAMLTKHGEELGKLREVVTEIDGDHAEARGSVKAARTILGLVLGVLIAATSWLVLDHLELRDRVNNNAAHISALERTAERHEEQAGHVGHERLSGDVRELQATIGEFREDVNELRSSLREMNDRRR